MTSRPPASYWQSNSWTMFEAQFAELWEHLISMDHHGYAGEVDDHEDESYTPAMPTSRVSPQQHRDKNTHWGLPINQCIPIFNAMVTR